MDKNLLYPYLNDSIDIYLKPIAITGDLMDAADPIEAVFSWRFGFILRRKYSAVMKPYYSLPFAKTVWICILYVTILVTVILYVIRRWEKCIFGHLECCFLYEFFFVVSVIYQHFLPTPSFLWARRIAIFFLVIFAYITHSFYTSNLLSYIVTDKEGRMDLKALVQSDYQLRIVENMKVATERRVNYLDMKKNIIETELSQTKVINISAGLEAVRTSKTALLCDYPSVQTFIARTFENEEICELEEVDIFSNVKMYFFAAKKFTSTEKFKIGTLRIKESGIAKRLIFNDRNCPVSCIKNTYHVRSQFDHIVALLFALLILYTIACLILLGEIIYYKNNKLWPYVD